MTCMSPQWSIRRGYSNIEHATSFKLERIEEEELVNVGILQLDLAAMHKTFVYAVSKNLSLQL